MAKRTPILLACLFLTIPCARAAWGGRTAADDAVRGAVIDRRRIDLSTEEFQLQQSGMRVAEINQALGESRVSPGAPDCLVAGKFFLMLNGDSLSKVVKNGSTGHAAAGRLRVQIDDCDSARTFGKNVVSY